MATHCWIISQSGYPSVLGAEPGAAALAAAQEVAHVLVTYNGQVCFTPYFASASTGTASAAEVWGNDRAWLQAVDSPYDQSVSSHWNTNGNSSGTARFSNPLGVDDFVKKSSFLYYTREALGEVAPRIADFAEREGLHAHAKSVTIRYEK